MVTPSSMMTGEPNFFSSTTERPLGPRVTFVALASLSTPSFIFLRASSLNRICLAMCLCLLYKWGTRLLQDAQDVVLVHDEVLFAVELDLAAGVLPVQDLVADLHVHGEHLAVLGGLALAGGHHEALLRLLLRAVRDDDPAALRLLRLDRLDQDAVAQRLDLHLAHRRF